MKRLSKLGIGWGNSRQDSNFHQYPEISIVYKQKGVGYINKSNWWCRYIHPSGIGFNLLWALPFSVLHSCSHQASLSVLRLPSVWCDFPSALTAPDLTLQMSKAWEPFGPNSLRKHPLIRQNECPLSVKSHKIPAPPVSSGQKLKLCSWGPWSHGKYLFFCPLACPVFRAYYSGVYSVSQTFPIRLWVPALPVPFFSIPPAALLA